MTGGIARYARSTPGYIPCTASRCPPREYVIVITKRRKAHGANCSRLAQEASVPPDQLQPTYELWTIRRESWLPPFPLTRRYERDRDPTSRSEE